jgi:hypothetical protein
LHINHAANEAVNEKGKAAPMPNGAMPKKKIIIPMMYGRM